jgi:hypothetical protein
MELIIRQSYGCRKGGGHSAQRRNLKRRRI